MPGIILTSVFSQRFGLGAILDSPEPSKSDELRSVPIALAAARNDSRHDAAGGDYYRMRLTRLSRPRRASTSLLVSLHPHGRPRMGAGLLRDQQDTGDDEHGDHG